MNIIKVKNHIELGETAARFFVETLTNVTKPVLGLATGSTPEKLYEILVNEYTKGKITFSDVTTFNLDEYVGLSGDDPNSYRYFMDTNLFNNLDIKKENTHIPNGLATNLEKECKAYEERMNEIGKIDLQILGLGLNGHIGFNEPGTTFNRRTHVVELNAVTREANARFFSSISEVPTQAITMGIDTIMKAKKILLLVQGNKKKEVLHQVVHGDVTEQIPASILQQHPNVTIITDVTI